MTTSPSARALRLYLINSSNPLVNVVNVKESR